MQSQISVIDEANLQGTKRSYQIIAYLFKCLVSY